MRRSKGLLAIIVVASLLGGSIAWAVALRIVPPGAYQVALVIDGDRLAIRLDRIAPADRQHHHHDSSTVEADGLHDEHVVTLATLEACSTADSVSPAKFCAPAAVHAQAIAVTHGVTLISYAGSSRTGPLLPDLSTVLRI